MDEESSDGSPTESEFVDDDDDDGTDPPDSDRDGKHHQPEPVSKKSRQGSAPKDASKAEPTKPPSKGRCSVGGSSGSGRSTDRMQYDLLMAEIGELEVEMILIR